jgi:chromosome partitioning protein
LPFPVVDERQALKAVGGHDYVVVDTPARPDSGDLSELAKGSDLLILPTIPDIVSLEPMLQMASDLGPDTRYRILLTMVPPYPNRDGVKMRDELIAAGAPVFRGMIRYAIGFKKAALAGIPVSGLTGRDRLGWLDYEAVGKEMLEVLSE